MFEKEVVHKSVEPRVSQSVIHVLLLDCLCVQHRPVLDLGQFPDGGEGIRHRDYLAILPLCLYCF